jgi:hypothetical protein
MLAGLDVGRIGVISESSGMLGIGGGGGKAMLGTMLESRDFGRLVSPFRWAMRRPGGSCETGLASSFERVPAVWGRFPPSTDGRGRGPSLTFGL